MALPKFTQGSLEFIFEKSRFTPVQNPKTPNQIIGKAGGGQIQVADLGDPENTFPIIVNRVSEQNKDDFWTFIEDATVNYSLYPFTFTDEDGTTYTVRFWDTDGIDTPKVSGGLYNIFCTLRKEIS